MATTQTEQTKTASQVFTFSGNGSGIYLLFVDKHPPSKHDLLVTDYSGVFTTLDSAMDWYDKRFLPYGEPQALIARFDGDRLSIIARSIVIGEDDDDAIAGHPCWVYAFDMDDDDY